MCNFSYDFRNFLFSNSIDFTERDQLFCITDPAITIKLVKLGDLSANQQVKANITLYEDEWYTKSTLISNRLLANLGKQSSIFARNCIVQPITSEVAKSFLDENHILGYVYCRYKYGLFTTKISGHIGQETLVAVASFSAPRPMQREGTKVLSYEWIRYASLANYRVAGGMGKLMKYFLEKISPQEIMSYADKDWSDGDVYRKLGFQYLSETPPIEFFVNRLTYERVSIKKLRNDRKFATPELNKEDWILLRNQGNLKFLWSAPFSQ